MKSIRILCSFIFVSFLVLFDKARLYVGVNVLVRLVSIKQQGRGPLRLGLCFMFSGMGFYLTIPPPSSTFKAMPFMVCWQAKSC